MILFFDPLPGPYHGLPNHHGESSAQGEPPLLEAFGIPLVLTWLEIAAEGVAS